MGFWIKFLIFSHFFGSPETNNDSFESLGRFQFILHIRYTSDTTLVTSADRSMNKGQYVQRQVLSSIFKLGILGSSLDRLIALQTGLKNKN